MYDIELWSALIAPFVFNTVFHWRPGVTPGMGLGLASSYGSVLFSFRLSGDFSMLSSVT